MSKMQDSLHRALMAVRLAEATSAESDYERRLVQAIELAELARVAIEEELFDAMERRLRKEREAG